MIQLKSLVFFLLVTCVANAGTPQGTVRLLIQSKRSPQSFSLKAGLVKLELSSVKALGPARWYQAEVSAENKNFTINELKKNPDVEWVEEDQQIFIQQSQVPGTQTNDTHLDSQWALKTMQVFQAWSLVPAKAKDVLVAVTDTGIDFNHPEFEGRIYVNPNEVANNQIDDDRNGYVDDVQGWDFEAKNNYPADDVSHGTHVSGIIGAAQNNAYGIAGIAPKVKLLPLRVFRGGHGDGSSAIEAIEYAIKMGAKIINASWGGFHYSKAMEDVLREAEAKGVLFVTAAGNGAINNDRNEAGFPSNYRFSNVISVANTNIKDELDASSNFGKTQVDVGAPGDRIVSTVMGNQFLALSGTSMSAAQVTGVAALLLAMNPKLTAQDLKRIILMTVNPLPTLKDKTISGGRINALAAALRVRAEMQGLMGFDGVSDDRELSGSTESDLRAARPTEGNIIKPDSVKDGESVQGLSVQLIRYVNDKETPITGLKFKAQLHGDAAQPGEWVQYQTNELGSVTDSTCNQESFSVSIALESDRYQVSTGLAPYQLIVKLKCGVQQKIIFDEKSASGQAMGIWQTATRAERKLFETVGLNFWKRQMVFKWPSNGDYYNFDNVNLTLGYQWDVVAHEMGHAIYDQAKIGQFGGGEHYIDRCYSDALALSEGWASFFSAWLNVDLADTDAKFQYMVPRRAPIRFENIPADVCKKSTNEWRVIGFLWDIIDTHDDGETLQESFQHLWKATIGTRASSIKAVKDHLIQVGWDPIQLNTLWKLNFPEE